MNTQYVLVQFIKKSKNSKTGLIPVTNSGRDTCPDNCPLKGKGGCYAEAGYYTRDNWNKLDNGKRGESYDVLISKIEKLPVNTLWRHNVSGDLQPLQLRGEIIDSEVIDATALIALVFANKGKKGFTYTHYDPENLVNSNLIKWANQEGFTINLSGNNLAHADTLLALNIAPVVSVVDENQTTNTVTPNGAKVVICPATTHENVTCKSCGLCQHRDRKYVIGFPAHGQNKDAIAL